jgi:hypothetical protein
MKCVNLTCKNLISPSIFRVSMIALQLNIFTHMFSISLIFLLIVSSSFLLTSLVQSLAMIIERVRSSKTSMKSYQITRSYITEHSNIHNHRCEKFKCKAIKIYSIVDHLLGWLSTVSLKHSRICSAEHTCFSCVVSKSAITEPLLPGLRQGKFCQPFC